MSTVEWADPPRAKTNWAPVADELRARPGDWACIKRSGNASLATQIKQGSLVAFRPHGSFEAKVASAGPGKYDVYARFVGEAASDD